MLKHSLMYPLALVAAAVLFTGCASEKEKEKRREDAFDLQGTYVASRAKGSETDVLVQVINETGRHDVRVEVSRGRALEDTERSFLVSKGINADAVASFFGTQVTMGANAGAANTALEGGDNISDDSGQSSRLQVCSSEYAYSATQKISYCLFATIRKSDYVLRGHLAIRIWNTVHSKGSSGQPLTTMWMEEKNLAIVAKTDQVFFTQYFGLWVGDWKTNLFASVDMSPNQTLYIRKLQDNTFEVQPAQTQIRFEGELYSYVPQAWPLAQLRDWQVPTFQVVFRKVGATDGQRLVFFGQIYSLSNMSGTMAHIRHDMETQLGSFQLKKK